MQSLTLEQIKRLELELLIEFDRICKDNNLYYTLCGGTLLGAVRHKGFIPWDDDIDVFMPRPDYERLLSGDEIKKEKTPRYMQFISWKNDLSYYPFLKMVDSRTHLEVPFMDKKLECSNVWIDIFPVDGAPRSEKKMDRMFSANLLRRKIWLYKMSNSNYGNIAKQFKKKLALQCLRVINLKRLCDKLDSSAASCSYADSEDVAGMLWGYGPQERMKKNEFEKSIDMEFEGYIFKAPSNYDTYLRGLYGEYMKLPPLDKRIVHEIQAYMADECSERS